MSRTVAHLIGREDVAGDGEPFEMVGPASGCDSDALIFGGHRIDRTGFYLAPSTHRVASTASRLWREDVFDPVAAIMTFESAAEAAALANDSDFGLVACVWTGNSTVRRELDAPFGGFHASGIGREGGRHSWEHFTEAKTLMRRYG